MTDLGLSAIVLGQLCSIYKKAHQSGVTRQNYRLPSQGRGWGEGLLGWASM